MSNWLLDIEFLNKSNILVAVSGGVDSMVLCHLLLQHQIEFSVAHVNYQLRGEDSQKDQAFVEAYCEKHQIQLFVKQFDTLALQQNSGKSIQMVARDLRYQWFEELVKNYQFDYLLTAHHKNDSIETFLINWMRGTGLSGLLGIPKHQGNILRPLLEVSKQEILAYAKLHQLAFREDLSNQKNDYKRNFVRNRVVPLLKEIYPQLEKTTQQTHQNLVSLNKFCEAQAQKVLANLMYNDDENEHLKLNDLKAIEGYEFLLFYWLKNKKFTAWPDIYNLVEAETGKIIYSPTHQLLKHRNELILSKKVQQNSTSILINTFEFEVDFPQKIKAAYAKEMINVTYDTIFVDTDLLHLPLIISNWQAADEFYPYKGNGKKKLSKFFKDIKLSMLEKQQVLVLKSQNQIVWVIGHRMDKRFVATENSTSILKIQLI